MNPWNLTEQECAALYYVAENGGNITAAARALSLSVLTLDRRCQSARKKMGVNRTAAALLMWDRFNREMAWKPVGDSFPPRVTIRQRILDQLEDGGKRTRDICAALGYGPEKKSCITHHLGALRDNGKIHTKGKGGERCVWFLGRQRRVASVFELGAHA